VEELEALFGAPSEKDDTSKTYTRLTYKYGSYQLVELFVYKESGVLERIKLQNFITPEDFDQGSASDEIPDRVLNYRRPAALGDDLDSYNFKLDGKIYTMPVPVCALIEDGWSVEKGNSDSVVAAGNFGYVNLRKGNQTYRSMVFNRAAYATNPENCWVERMLFASPEGSQSGIRGDWELPLGINPGMSQKELEAALKDVKYKKENAKIHVYYEMYFSDYIATDCIKIMFHKEGKRIDQIEIEHSVK
jgi:hypothetical protein